MKRLYFGILFFIFALSACQQQKKTKHSLFNPSWNASVIFYKNTSIIPKNSEEQDWFLKENVQQEILLNKEQLLNLESILEQDTSGVLWGARCYHPRHCILFKDKNNTIVAYLELCFQCNNFISSLDEIKIKSHTQMDNLEKWITQIGIKNDE